MAIANVIYGVTMGEPGVSRKVSVKFSDLHEQGYELGAPIQDVKAETDAAEPVARQEPAWSADRMRTSPLRTCPTSALAKSEAAGDELVPSISASAEAVAARRRTGRQCT